MIVFFDRDRVGLTARIDLPEPSAVPALVAEITALGRRARASKVVLLVYSSDPRGQMVLDRLVAESGLKLVEALLVSPERWRSALCPDAYPGQCCPSEGTPYDLSGHRLCAEAVLAGMSAASDRTAVEAMVAGPATGEVPVLEELAAAAVLGLAGRDQRGRARRIRGLVTRSLADPDGMSDADCAELAALCLDVTVRDVAWAMMSRDEAPAHLALWRRVLARTVDDLSSAPLGLAAMAAWISGDGALLNCCIARLEELDPAYGLLSICQDISRGAVPPSMWDKMSAEMRTDPALLAG